MGGFRLKVGAFFSLGREKRRVPPGFPGRTTGTVSTCEGSLDRECIKPKVAMKTNCRDPVNPCECRLQNSADHIIAVASVIDICRNSEENNPTHWIFTSAWESNQGQPRNFSPRFKNDDHRQRRGAPSIQVDGWRCQTSAQDAGGGGVFSGTKSTAGGRESCGGWRR